MDLKLKKSMPVEEADFCSVRRPSGGEIHYGKFFIKKHPHAAQEAQLLMMASRIFDECLNVTVPEPIITEDSVLVLPYLEPSSEKGTSRSYVQDKALRMVSIARALHQYDEAFGFRRCSEEEYRQYVLHPEDPDWGGSASQPELQEVRTYQQYFRAVVEKLGPEVDQYGGKGSNRFIHGDFTFSNCYYLEKMANVATHAGCLVDLSVKATPGFPELDLSKILFSCLGFDTAFHRLFVDNLIGPSGLMQMVYGNRIRWDVMAYGLASHVLRVVRRERLSKPILERAAQYVAKMIRIHRYPDYPDEVIANSPIIRDSELPLADLLFEQGWTPRRTLIVTDMDGTLIDSYVATVNAYAKAGFDFKPEYWGKSASDIGIPPEAHQLKLELWPNYVPQIKLLYMARELAEALKKGTTVILLTGASEVTTKAGLKRLEPVLTPSAVIHGCGRDAKIAAIHSLCLANPDLEVIYIDDDKEFLELLLKRSNAVGLFHVNNLEGQQGKLDNLILFHADSPRTIETPRSLDS